MAFVLGMAASLPVTPQRDKRQEQYARQQRRRCNIRYILRQVEMHSVRMRVGTIECEQLYSYLLRAAMSINADIPL